MKKLIYIAGSARSGSTLLDIVLGNHSNTFSVGELNKLFKSGLINSELCSCGNVVKDCDIWKDIIDEWQSQAKLEFSEYSKLVRFYESRKNWVRLLKELKRPSDRFKIYLNDTKKLYSIISQVTFCDTLIESSKSPNRALILSHIYPKKTLIVVHLLRKFSNVLNSHKKILKKNLAKGIEESTKKKGVRFLFYIIPIWLFENALIYIFLKKRRKIVTFEDYIKDPSAIAERIHGEKVVFVNNYEAEHLVAGNRLRMKSNITVKGNIDSGPLTNLSFFEKLIARFIDLFL